MSEAQNIAMVRELARVFKNEHNVDGVGHLIHQDFKHNYRSNLPDGFEGMRQVGLMLNGAFADAVFTQNDLIASGDKVVERASTTATHSGSMMGEQPTHKSITWSEINIYQFKDGKIIEHWVEMEMWQLLQQTGILPPMGG